MLHDPTTCKNRKPFIPVRRDRTPKPLPGSWLTLCLLPFCNKGWTRHDTILFPPDLRKLSPKDLMKIGVASASKRTEKPDELSSVIQVIAGEDIHWAGLSGFSFIPGTYTFRLENVKRNSYESIY